MSTTSYAELNALLERAGRPSSTPVPISEDQLLGLQRRWATALGARLDQAIERAGAEPTLDAVASAWRQLVADQPIMRGILDAAESHSPSLAEAMRGESRMLALAAGVAGLDEPFDQAAHSGRAYRDMIHRDQPTPDVAHGPPLVVGRASKDKPEVAARVAWCGAGIDLRTGQPGESAIRSAVPGVLPDPSYRARSADLIEALVRAGETPRPREGAPL